VSSTERHEGPGPAVAAEPTAQEIEQALELVRQADTLVRETLPATGWPQRLTVEHFLEGDRLERVLGLYCRAMRLDPLEPSYPWNLAVLLSRVRIDELALSFIERAIRVAIASGDEEWADAGAHVAWAEIAVRAGQDDVALVALARARTLSREGSPSGESIRRILDGITKRHKGRDPNVELAHELMRMTA